MFLNMYLVLSHSPQGLGLLQWALIASASSLIPAYGWVMFVAVTLWLLTIILFFMLFFGAYHKLSSVPWPMLVSVLIH